jgi:hypothetical protein
VNVALYNSRLMPTMSQAAVTNKVQRPDILSVDGNIEVLAAGRKASTSLPAGIPAQYRRFFRGRGSADTDITAIEQPDLKNLKLLNGIPGRTEVEYQFLVEGKGKVSVKLDCVKGGRFVKTVELK